MVCNPVTFRYDEHVPLVTPRDWTTTVDGRSSTVDRLRRSSPEFAQIAQTIVTERWRRFIDSYDPARYEQGGLSTSYPLLRSADVVYLQGWDGDCFPPFHREGIDDLVIATVGGAMRQCPGITVAWLIVEQKGNLHYSLQVTAGVPWSHDGLQQPYLVNTRAD